MQKRLVNLLINSIAVVITAYLLPGVLVKGFMAAFVVSMWLAVINTFSRPILAFLTLPITLATLGIFILILNSALILMVDKLTVGFYVNNWLTAIAFSLVLWGVNGIMMNFLNRRKLKWK
ncbi:MAG: phage holin family protein [Chitinophagales bacterium]